MLSGTKVDSRAGLPKWLLAVSSCFGQDEIGIAEAKRKMNCAIDQCFLKFQSEKPQFLPDSAFSFPHGMRSDSGSF